MDAAGRLRAGDTNAGYALLKSVIQSKALGGDCLADTTLRYMEEKMKGEIKPRYAFKKKLQTGGKNDGKFKIENLSFQKRPNRTTS